MNAILSNLQAVKQQLNQAATDAGRDAAGITLLAVSKTFPADAVREAYAAGQRAFGENYVQEALQKIAALSDLPLEWHFIAPIQSNKTRDIAGHFSWAHAVDRASVARRLSAQRPATLPPLNICLQINVSGESTKNGLPPNITEIAALAREIISLPNLKLRGLMAIPAPSDDPVAQRQPYAHINQLKQQLKALGIPLDTLSMGMSHDFSAAIAEGATTVRVGTAIFGMRPIPLTA